MGGRPEQLVMAEHPQIDDVAELRRFRRERLAVAFRVFARLGYNTGPGGHAAVRDPEHPDWLWTNPFGNAFDCMRVSDLILVDDDGQLRDGEGIVNRAAFVLHSRVHAVRPDAVASVHLHGIHGMAWSALARPLSPITQEACAFFEDQAEYAFDGPQLEIEDGDRLAKTFGPHKALILHNHGVMTVGESIDEAAFWMIRMQMACQVQLLAEAAGPVVPIPDDIARATRLVNGTPRAGWFGFQPFCEAVVRTEPDVLD